MVRAMTASVNQPVSQSPKPRGEDEARLALYCAERWNWPIEDTVNFLEKLDAEGMIDFGAMAREFACDGAISIEVAP